MTLQSWMKKILSHSTLAHHTRLTIRARHEAAKPDARVPSINTFNADLVAIESHNLRCGLLEGAGVCRGGTHKHRSLGGGGLFSKLMGQSWRPQDELIDAQWVIDRHDLR